MNIRYNKHDLVLNGNQLSGDTYAVKDFIKGKLDGQWNATGKTWTVNVDKVNYWIEKNVITVNNSDHSNAQKVASIKITGDDGWCPICHDWTYGDCIANGAHH